MMCAPSSISRSSQPEAVFKWAFKTWDDEDDFPKLDKSMELQGISAGRFTARSKARKWLSAARGKPLEAGENIGKVLTELPMICQIEVENNTESGFAKIVNVLPASKRQRKAKLDSSLLEASNPNDDDDV